MKTRTDRGQVDLAFTISQLTEDYNDLKSSAHTVIVTHPGLGSRQVGAQGLSLVCPRPRLKQIYSVEKTLTLVTII